MSQRIPTDFLEFLITIGESGRFVGLLPHQNQNTLH